jgi:hydrogenase/urease accessory protein HupE
MAIAEVLFNNNGLPVLLHLVNAQFGDFYAGFFHVATAMEHMLAIVALGLFAGQQNPRNARITLVTFVLSFMAGAITGTFLFESISITVLCVISLVVIGGLVAIQKEWSVLWLVLIAVYLGLVQGVANGAALGNGFQPLNFLSGLAFTGIVIVTLSAGMAISMIKTWQKVALRVLGSWFAAIGIIYLPFLIMNI